MKKGVFIAFEGIDGSGKGTQAARLAERLKKMGVDFYSTFEPTYSPIGSLIRNVLTGRIACDNLSVAALFAADRLDHLQNNRDGILSKINGGTSVICDRYYFSSYAYHSVDMPMKWVMDANSQAAALLRPTVTVFIDITAEEAMKRIYAGRFDTELFENTERLTKARENYFKAFELTKKEENVVVIDGSRTPDEIEAAIWEKLRGYFE